MNDVFTSWLSSEDRGWCGFQDKGYFYIVIRVEKTPDFDYLFCQRRYREEGLLRDSAFKYAGIYCKRDGLLYDAQYELKGIEHELGTMADKSAPFLLEQLKKAVRQKVETVIGNDPANLSITELTDKDILTRMEYACKHYAKEEARRRYLDTVDFEPPVFCCGYEPERWTEDSLLAYILDTESYAQKETADYIAAKQEDMLYSFLYNAAVLREYQAIKADTENPVHTVKKIMAAMQTTSAKTVNVTICKDGIEFTFKTEAHVLRGDCQSYYNTWCMTAADRREFEQLYGRSTDYYPQEILKITYARSVLYQKA